MKYLTLVIMLLCFLDCKSQNIDKKTALADFNEFISLLETHSSYYQITNLDFKSRFQKVRDQLSKKDSIPVYYLAHQIEKIIAETIDRHASVKIEDLDEDNIEILNLYLPFVIAPLKDKAVALKRNPTNKIYEYYLPEYPFVKNINQIPIDTFIKQYAYKRKNNPKAAKLYDGLKDLGSIGELFFKQGDADQKKVSITFSNENSEKTISLPLTNKKNRWINIGHPRDKEIVKAMYFDEPFDYSKLDKWLRDSIAYLLLPSMFSYEDFPDLENYINKTITKYRAAKAFIIDLRGNGGGTRHLLNTLAPYIVQPDQSPWIANVAYIRNEQGLDEDIESMSDRYLFSYHSKKFTTEDRQAIDRFEETFNPVLPFNKKKFSKPFYMLLKSNETPLSCPIYILVDERSFSAASVFASALKGLSNVKIVGTTTNGSSGRSKVFHLPHSNIRVKISTMLSVQRNGKPLDGYGTTPDVKLERGEEQVLGEKDAQLEELIDKIIDRQI